MVVAWGGYGFVPCLSCGGRADGGWAAGNGWGGGVAALVLLPFPGGFEVAGGVYLFWRGLGVMSFEGGLGLVLAKRVHGRPMLTGM